MSTYTPIASFTVTAATSSVTFANIPQTYTDLMVVTNTQLASGLTAVNYRFNSDATSSYSATRLYGNDLNVATSDRFTNMTSGYIGFTSTTNFVTGVYQFMNYSNTTSNKTVLGRSGIHDYGSYVFYYVGLWRNTSAVNSLTLLTDNGTNWNAGSTFAVYGISSADGITPKATGGNEVWSDGTYWYHKFTSSGTLTTSANISNVDYLVIAGGGGANTSAEQSGGGGAGGLRSTVTATGGGGSLESKISLTNSIAYSIAVGAGGTFGSNGGNSSISGTGLTTITSTGGGFGSGRGAAAGNGGSGGGGGDYGGTRGTGTSNQGYNGANGGGGDPGGGGGGAGGAGGAPVGNTGGARGAGLAVSITGQSITYAEGGIGGGATTGIASIPNLGKGGDAGESTSYAGGSGVVIIRYAV